MTRSPAPTTTKHEAPAPDYRDGRLTLPLDKKSYISVRRCSPDVYVKQVFRDVSGVASFGDGDNCGVGRP